MSTRDYVHDVGCIIECMYIEVRFICERKGISRVRVCINLYYRYGLRVALVTNVNFKCVRWYCILTYDWIIKQKPTLFY
jgi:hypothetical protein